MATSITKKPTLAVSKLCAPVRQSGNRVMKSTWKVPGDLTKSSNKARAESLVIEWTLNIPGKNDPKYVKTEQNEKATASQINLNSLKIGKTTYTRALFYPCHSSRKLYSVTCKVTPKNKKGNGKAASQTRKFETPRAPSISAFSFNTENGEVSATITTDAGNDYKERYDTRYTVYIENTRTGQKYNYRDTSSTSTSITVTFDASDYQQLDYSQYIKIKITAWSRGFAGDSAKVSKEFFVSYPAQATVQDVNVSAKDSTGKATVAVNTNSTTQHPVDRVKLEYLANTNYEREADIPGDASPTETSIIDDAQCTALAMPVGPLIPDKGKYTWIRVKSWHLSEEVLYRYSAWMRVTALETPAPTAADDEIVILEANAGADGQSAVLLLGWNADGTDDSTGTEITWADEEDVWKSTQDPSRYEFEWSDGELEYDNVLYHDSATLTIKNLEEATQYFIKARRYLTGEITTYLPYSNAATVLTSEKPEKVIASCDRYVPTGKALSVYWTFSGNGVQKEWQIVSTEGTVLAKGEGGISSTQISADRLNEFATNGSITFTVQTSTGSGFVISESHTVTIIEQPTLQITGGSYTYEHEEIEREYSGEIVTIENINGESIKSLTPSIEPIQDLHGYDKPWAGGAGKNLLDTSGMSTAGQSGVTFSRASDGVITVGGKANTTVYRAIGSIKTVSGVQYTITGVPSGGASGKYRMTVVGYGYDYGSGYTFTGDGNSHDISLDIYTGYPSSGTLTFKPMIRLASETDATYEPYENICPISGRDSVDATRVGKNLCPKPSATASGNGNLSLIVNGKYGENYKANTTYTVSFDVLETNNGRFDLRFNNATVHIWNANTLSVGTRAYWTFTPTEDGYISLWSTNGAYSNDKKVLDNIQVESGSTATEYEPYNGQTYTTALGRTVYGGTLDVTSGVLTVDRAMVDLGDLNWRAGTDSIGQFFLGALNGAKATRSTAQIANALCSIYPIAPSNNVVDGSLAIGTGATPNVYVRDTRFSDATSFKTAMNGVQLVYELATPQTYQLTPTEVKTLLGTNNIWANSGDVEVDTVEVTLDENQLHSNDLSLNVASNRLCDLITTIKSQGASGQFPQGIERQTPGDTIYSDVLVPEWTASGDAYTATIALPPCLNFWDNGNYNLSVTAIDRTTGLRSAEMLAVFSIEWAHQAVDPGDYVTITPIDTYDAEGFHRIAAMIELTPPAESEATDVYDIYRLTGDGAQLIGEGFPLTYTAYDEYAPFGINVDLAYRVAIRTLDGDVEFADIEYVFEQKTLRFDWMGGFLELPYNISIGDTYKKDVEIRQHMDGSVDGYWNQNIVRTAKLSTDVIKLDQKLEIDMARALARYAGAVFVRTPEGTAYEADVQVSDMSASNKHLMAIAIDVQETGLTKEFALPTPFDLEEEEE